MVDFFMRIEIDQSGKIEKTNKSTIIAFSNGVSSSVLVKAKDKQELQKFFRKMGKGRVFVYNVFAILIFILIRPHLNQIDQVIIDDEYTGQSYLIKNFLMQNIKKDNPNFTARSILFRNIGRKSKAHLEAYGVALNKRKAAKVISAREVLKFLA